MNHGKELEQMSENMLAEGLVQPCPPDGGGCNAWNYRTIITLLAAGVSKEEATELVRQMSCRLDKAKLAEETTRSIERAEEFLALDESTRKKRSRPKRFSVPFDYECLKEQVADVGDPYEILDKHSDECHSVSDYLAKLFRPGEIGCVLRSARYKKDLFFPKDFKRPPYESRVPGGEEGVFFLNNPVVGSSVQGSYRSKNCVTEFRHLVLECDHPASEFPDITGMWLQYLITLPVPIKSIVTSGGKSIHAIVDLGTETEHDFDLMLDTLFEPLVMSGADPNSLTPVRLTRLPYSFRGKKEQELLYVKSEPGEYIES